MPSGLGDNLEVNVPASIFVAGYRGMVGSAIVRRLLAAGHPADRLLTRTHAELDLTDQSAVRAFFERQRPDQVKLHCGDLSDASAACGIHPLVGRGTGLDAVNLSGE